MMIFSSHFLVLASQMGVLIQIVSFVYMMIHCSLGVTCLVVECQKESQESGGHNNGQ